MRYRKLGRPGTEVGIIGLGAEHLEKASPEMITAVVDVATEAGVNYANLLLASADARDYFEAALAGRRERMVIAGRFTRTACSAS